ncbi:S-layer homology domain-containing protein [Anoxybacterium hadale]|uniref:S-layer homology domain-containing protein n=1 Tax=Anoxybacterium hadale TaxID=3408580 RepID=A0ACD1ACS2_9FIRM|nr:S-layer homology domain-containing protein [Clostridiales bacterium]
MKTNKRNQNRVISFLLLISMMITMIPMTAFAESPVVTDSTDLDVFMNIDPSLGIKTSDFQGLVEDKLEKLNEIYKVENDTKTYRFKTSAATIDPTDITKWEVYDHYDTAWYADDTAWYANFNGDDPIPSNWYHYPVTDQFTTSVKAANAKTSIKTMLSDKAGTTTTGTSWGNTAGLKSHIYAYKENDKPAMQFYGYGTDAWADFLYYPASASSSKSVKFNVDASNVLPHSLKYAGFLINAGTTGTGSSKTINGYVILFEYGPPNGTTPATYLIGAYLYKLTNVNVDTLHRYGLKNIANSTTAGWTKIKDAESLPFYSKSHIELAITSDGLKATVQQLDGSGNLTGSPSYLFGASNSYQTLNDTGFGGFGPYVDYGVSGHTCQNTSSFRYSNLEMSFAETLSGSSALEAYQFSDYLNKSKQKFFVNLTSPSTQNYSVYETMNDTDAAFLNMLASNKTVLITDEHEDTYLEKTLGENAKDVNDIDVTVVQPLLGTNPNEIEILAAKVAWLIYSTAYNPDATQVEQPDSVAVASLTLLDGPGTGSSWNGAKQINQIKKELMSGNILKVYLNPDGSQNADGLTASYTLTKPNGTIETLTPIQENGKSYFEARKTDAVGDYKVTLSYAINGGILTSIPAAATYSVLTDSIAPTTSVSVSGAIATLTFTNTAGTKSGEYTSKLDSYAVYISTSASKPAVADELYTPVTDDAENVNVAEVAEELSLTLSPETTYYFHVLLKDEAGNIGHTAQAFTFDGPRAAFTNPSSNSYTADTPFTGSAVTFSLTKGSSDIATYQIGTGASSPTFGAPAAAGGQTSVEYILPIGTYRLWIKATDEDGRDSAPISIYVNTKKRQELTGTKTYVFEAGVDKEATLDYTSASVPVLAGGESLGAILYEKMTDPNHSISLSDTGGKVTINNYVGTATIQVKAEGTATHHEATDLINVRVVKPFSVSLVMSDYSTATGITVYPDYNDYGSFGLGSTRELKYRKAGTTGWTSVPAADWNWKSPYTLAFSGMDAGTKYEMQLFGQNAKAQPTIASSDIRTFTTPYASATPGGGVKTGTGTATITLKDTEIGTTYEVSIQTGDAVVDSVWIPGTGTDITHTFENLIDGNYNIVVKTSDEMVTERIQIKDGKLIPENFSVKLIGSSNTRIRMKGKSPDIAVGKLSDLLKPTTNTDDAAGVTVADQELVSNGGKILIELVSTGYEESDEEIKDDVDKINKIKGGQTLAMLVDLSVFKTVWEPNSATGEQNRMTTIPEKLTVAVPLSNIKGSNVKVYRVHGNAVAQVIPEARLDADGVTYVWADNYQIDGSTLTKGSAVGSEEYVVLSGEYAVLYVDKFSTYAVGYTRSSSSGSSKPAVTQTVAVDNPSHGKVTGDTTGKKAGDTVTLKVTPDDGYVLSKLDIRDANGNKVSYIQNSDGTYRFTMPASAVTIKAEFEKQQTGLADPSVTGVAKWLITDDHIRYMVGDDNGYFNPDKNMTRAEAAQMFYNLLLNKDVNVTASFADVAEGAWYQKAVETLAALGVVTGYDGVYSPNKNISRAEFTAIAMRFAVLSGGNASFSDVSSSDWAHQYIMSAAGYGWINGYSDGTYKPQALITRAEVVTIVNNMLGRSADKEYIDNNLSNLKIFPDVNKNSYWAYYGIVEATNAHDFEKANGKESWTDLN